MKKRICITLLLAILCGCMLALFGCGKNDKCEHKFGEYQIVLEETCVSMGVKTRTCSTCNYKETEYISAKGHTYGEFETIIESTCESDGIKIKSCLTCGDEVSEKIDKLNHSYGEFETIIESTCESDGIKIKSCLTCGDEVSEKIDKLNHSYGEFKTIIESTCESDGIKIKSCLTCGDEVSEKIDKLNHTTITDKPVAATCTTNGLTEGSHCGRCNKVFVAQEVVLATGHSYTEEVTLEATCNSVGEITLSCGCGYSYIKEYALEPLSAEQIFEDASDYTCTVLIYCPYDNSVFAFGTGFVYSSNEESTKIITNYHVIAKGNRAAILFTKGETEQFYRVLKVVACDKNADLAILEVDSPVLPVAPICDKEMKTGSTIYALGSSKGFEYTFSKGIITYYNRIVDGVSNIQIDASITNGNSGGPLINEYGEVIGVNTWGIVDAQNLNFAINISELKNLTEINLTLEEFYNINTSAYDKLYDFVDYNGGDYSQSGYFNNDTEYRETIIGYNEESDFLYVEVCYKNNSGVAYNVIVELQPINDGFRYLATKSQKSSDDTFTKESEVVGVIPSTFTAESMLTYIVYEGTEPSAELVTAFTNELVILLNWLDTVIKSNIVTTGVSLDLADLGFNSFVAS